MHVVIMVMAIKKIPYSNVLSMFTRHDFSFFDKDATNDDDVTILLTDHFGVVAGHSIKSCT